MCDTFLKHFHDGSTWIQKLKKKSKIWIKTEICKHVSIISNSSSLKGMQPIANAILARFTTFFNDRELNNFTKCSSTISG